ncbi:MAG TPA: helix-turn-helix domain-containing protein [Pseudonocardia sp.]
MPDSPSAGAAPRKRGPKPLLGEHPRDRIHDATLACFERQGIRETSMDDVARELGISRTALYHYFATKEDLLLEVVARQAGLILADLPHRLTAVGLERVAEAVYLGVIGSLDNKYVKLMIEGAAAPLTGTVMETSRILELQRAFWIPLLTHARERHGMRTDLPLEEIMDWVIFLQFSLAMAGPAFGMSRDQMRERIYAHLIPDLRG